MSTFKQPKTPTTARNRPSPNPNVAPSAPGDRVERGRDIEDTQPYSVRRIAPKVLRFVNCSQCGKKGCAIKKHKTKENTWYAWCSDCSWHACQSFDHPPTTDDDIIAADEKRGTASSSTKQTSADYEEAINSLFSQLSELQRRLDNLEFRLRLPVEDQEGETQPYPEGE